MSISISGNGSITGVLTSYTFDKSVSIGGTLTYEDVTNIDSVGIITAQSGVVIGTGTSIGNPTTNELGLYTNSSERIRIDSSGRLLVGTASASNNTRLNQKLAVVSTGIANQCGMALVGYSGTVSSGNAPFIDLCRSRGTSDGSYTEVVNGDTLGYLIFRGADGAGWSDAVWIKGEADGDWTTSGDTTDSPGRLVFSTTADGASSPTSRLEIKSNGEIRSGSGLIADNSNGAGERLTGGGFIGINNDTFNTVAICFRVQTGSTKVARMYIRNDGDLENTNNSYGGISDIKLKENVVDANSQWNDLKALQVRNYNFKAETGYGIHTQIGLIAQEVELVSPGLVSESPDTDDEGSDLGTVTKSVNYSVLYMKAVKALQEAMERIEVLEASNADLLGRVSVLEQG